MDTANTEREDKQNILNDPGRCLASVLKEIHSLRLSRDIYFLAV